MKLWAQVVALSLLGAFSIFNSQPAGAVELTIFLNQATESGVRELAAAFEKATGNKVDVSFQGGGALNQKINNGEGDLASLGLQQFEPFVKGGKVVPGSVVEYARVGNGVAVKAGAPKPDISTPEAFKAACSTPSRSDIAVRGPALQHHSIPTLGIYDQIKDKIKIVQGRPNVAQSVATAVPDGEVEIGIQQTNVIQPFLERCILDRCRPR